MYFKCTSLQLWAMGHHERFWQKGCCLPMKAAKICTWPKKISNEKLQQIAKQKTQSSTIAERYLCWCWYVKWLPGQIPVYTVLEKASRPVKRLGDTKCEGFEYGLNWSFYVCHDKVIWWRERWKSEHMLRWGCTFTLLHIYASKLNKYFWLWIWYGRLTCIWIF